MSSSTSGRCHYVELGKPPPKKFLNQFETIKFVIHDFKERKGKLTKGRHIASPIAEAHGHQWSIAVYPHGDAKHEDICCYLSMQTKSEKNPDVIVKQTWRCKGFKPTNLPPVNFTSEFTTWGRALERDENLENVLEDERFEIEIDIYMAAENQRVWYPKELQQQDILVELYQDASSDTSDVVFSVGESIYRVHKSILSLRCKKLYEIAKECDSGVPIPIDSTNQSIFKSVLDFVYTVNTPVIENEITATELLVAADRFECVHLKLYVESVMVDTFLKAGNSAALLLLADSHSCALLKEAAINLLVTDAGAGIHTDAWANIGDSNGLLKELFLASSHKDYIVRTSEIDRMDVTALREALEGANLELDGSRAVLCDRWKTHRHRTTAS